jgi:hypothetical protein
VIVRQSDVHLRQMDFSTLPVDALHRYLAQYDLIPAVHPSPLSVHDPPPPPSLLGQGTHTRGSSRGASPPAVTTPANRPRRESRRRNSRPSEEEGWARTPVLADVAEVQTVLAGIAQRHFEGQVVKEVDSLASFMCVVKGRGTVCSPGFYERTGLIHSTATVTVALHFGRRVF